MAICGHLAPNGEKSILYDELYQKYGEAKAHDIWEQVRSQQFLNKHGDWPMIRLWSEKERKALEKSGKLPLDANGEPTTEWVEKTLDVKSEDKLPQLRIELNALKSDPDNTDLRLRIFYNLAFYESEASKKNPDAKWKGFKDALTTELSAIYPELNDNAIKKAANIAWAISEAKFEAQEDAFLDNEQLQFRAMDLVEDWQSRIKQYNLQSYLDRAPYKDVDYSKTELLDNTVETIVTTITGTKDKTSGRIPEASVREQIQAIYAEAEANPDKNYVLPFTYTTGKKKNSIGYTAKGIASIIMSYPVPANVMVDPGLMSLVQNSAENIVKEFASDIPVEFMNSNEPAVLESAARLLVPKLDVNGERQGFFSPKDQADIVNAIVAKTKELYFNDPAMKDKSIIAVMQKLSSVAMALQGTSNKELADTYMAIHQSRGRFTEMALRQLGSLGLRINNRIKARILNTVTNEEVPELKEEWENDQPTIEQIEDIFEDGFETMEGRIARDWSDATFELDPKDTASARIKMFMGTLQEMDNGVYKIDKDGEQLPDDLNISKLTYPESLKLAKRLNRKGFWFKDYESSKKLKAILDGSHPRLPKDNVMGLPIIADYNEMFRSTLNVLGNKPQNTEFKDFIALLLNHPNPTIQQMAIELEKTDQSMKNEFMTVMMKQYQPFIVGRFDKVSDGGKKSYVLEPMNSNLNSQRDAIISTWIEKQKLAPITILSDAKERILDINHIKKEWMPVLDKAQNMADWTLPENRAWFVEKIGKIFMDNGIELPEAMLQYMYQYPKSWSKDSSLEGLFSTTLQGQPQGDMAIFIMRAAGLTDIDTDNDPLERAKLSQMNNPLIKETTFMRKLAKLYGKYNEETYSSNHLNAKGRNVWDWGLNTKLSHAFRAFSGTEASFNQFAINADNVHISSNNWLIRKLTENPNQITNMELQYMDALKPAWAKKGTDRQAMSDREQMVMSILLFQNKGYGFNRESKVNFMSLTHSDKTMTPIFKNIPKVDVGEVNKTPATLIGTMDSVMFNVFKAEHSRIINHKDVDFNNRQYDRGKGLFYFIPDFNYDSMKDLVAAQVITEEEFKTIWLDGTRTLTKIIDSTRELPIINKVLTHFTSNLWNNTLNKWRDNKIVTDTEIVADSTYLRRLMKNNDIVEVTREGRTAKESKTMYRFKNSKEELAVEDFTKIMAVAAAKDYAINSFLFNTSLSQLFYGDPAETYKGSKIKGAKDIDHVRSTMVQYNKRLAKDIAPRADLYWAPEKRLYNTLTLADVMTTDTYLNQIGELKKFYGDTKNPITSTDAQELTTVQEKLDVLYAAGQITTKVHTEMSGIIKEAGLGNYYEFTLPEHLEVIMQPEKPLYAGTQAPKNGAMLTDYVKSSAWALYPPFTQGRGLDDLRKLMETNNIARANYESGKKIGNPTNPLEVFSSTGEFIDPTTEQLGPAIKQLSRDGFGIQQEVPYDEGKEEIKTLTQMNEGITEGIMELEGFTLPGRDPVNGRELKALKENVRKELLQVNLDKLYKKLNVDADGNIDLELILGMLEEEIKSDTRNSYTINELQSIIIRDADGTPMIPLAFNTAADKLEGLLMSIINKVADVKMPGKSYVQASGTGTNYKFKDATDSDLSKMVRIGNWDGSPLKTMRIENGVVKAAQVLLPFNFYDNKGNKLKVKDFLKPGTNELDLDRLPIELLQLIGGRIPNQGHSSMLPLEVVGFVPDNMGDLAFVPAAIVKQMGADFDVDKLYTYKRPYNYNDATKRFEMVGNVKTQERLGADNDEWIELRDAAAELAKIAGEQANNKGRYPIQVFNKYLAEAVSTKYGDTEVPKHIVTTEIERGVEHMQQDYFNIHWSVLTHPDMIERVLRPLDQADLSEESELLRKAEGSYYNFYDPQTQMETFQSGKDAKRLVGLTSWAVKFNQRIQDKNLRISKLEFNEKTFRLETVPDTITVRDEFTGEPRELILLSGDGKSVYSKSGKEPTTPEAAKLASRTKGNNIINGQSEAVDNANNRVLDNLNFTPETHRAVQALMQLQTEDGWAPNVKYWTRLLTQPIIWEFSKEMAQGNDSLSEVYDPNLYQNTIRKLRSKYTEMLEGEQDSNLANDILLAPETLLKSELLEGNEYPLYQIAVLNMFDKLYNIGKRIFELEAQFNQDVGGAGPNMFTAMDRDRNLQDLDKPPIMNAEDLYINPVTRKLTEVGFTFDALNGTALKILSQIFPYKNLGKMFDILKASTNKTNLTVDQQKAFMRALRSATFTAGKYWWNDAQVERVRLIYGEQSLAKRIDEAKNTWGVVNPLLNNLKIKIADNSEEPDYVTYKGSNKATDSELQGMSTGWMDMLLSTDLVQRQLGEDLIRYAYLSGGIPDANSFVKFAPIPFIANTEFAAHLKDVASMLSNTREYENYGLLIQFMQHNPDMASGVMQKHFGLLEEGREYPESFRIPDTDALNIGDFMSLTDANGTYLPFLSYRSKSDGKWILYKKHNVQEGTYYVRIDTLGNEFMDEYNGEAEAGQRSIFEDNRSLAEQIPGLQPLQSISDSKMESKLEDGENYFHRIGIREGGVKELNSALGNIADNKNIPQYLRTVAKFMANTKESSEGEVAKQVAMASGKPFLLSYFSKLGIGGESHFDNQMYLNPDEARNETEAAETFLHELMHNRLQFMILAAGHDTRIFRGNDTPLNKMLQAGIDRYRKQYPEVVKHIEELERVRYEGYNALRNTLGEQRFNDIAAEVESGINNTPEHNIYYALSSLQELVAHITTDKPIQEFLNSIEDSKGTTILSRIWDSLLDMLEAIGKALGIKVNDKSLLRTALAHTFKIMDIQSSSDIDITQHLVTPEPIVTNTEAQAEELQTLLETVYNRNTELSSNEVNFILINQKRRTQAPVPGQRGKILEKLKEQLSEISDARSTSKDLQERVKLGLRWGEIKRQIDSIYQDTNLDKIVEVGKQQLMWVDQVLANPNATVVDTDIAINTANIWSSVIDIMYGGIENRTETNEDFIKLEGAGREKRRKLIDDKSQKILIDEYKRTLDVTLTPMEFKEKLTDISIVGANVLALTRAKTLFVQAAAGHVWQAANNKDEHVSRNTKDLYKLQDDMDKIGMTGHDMLQLDATGENWTLINKFSPAWYNHIKSLRSFLENSIEGINKSETMEPAVRTEKRQAAWADYWAGIHKSNTIVDSRKFFDMETGAKVSDSSKEFQELSEAVGSDVYAQELINQAQEKLKKYIEEREIVKEHIDSTTDLTAEEAEGLTDEEQIAKLEIKIENEINSWIRFHSPLELLGKLESGKQVKYESHGDQFLVMVPVKTNADFFDAKYQKLENNPAMKAIYNRYMKLYKEMVSYLPIDVQDQMPDNHFPVVPKDTANWLARTFSKIKNWDKHALDALTATDTEEALRLRPNKIPVLYIHPRGITKEIDERSTDPIRVLEAFSMMALQHKYMGEVLATVNIAEGVLKEANRRRLEGLEEGKTLKNIMDGLAYVKDALIFKKPTELQGKLNNKIYSINPVEQVKTQNKIKDLIKERDGLDQKVKDLMLEGDFSATEAIDIRINEINKELTGYEKDARNIYASKVSDTLIGINQMKALYYNPFSAVNNFTFAAISLSIYARGRTDFSPKDLRAAQGVMTHSMKKYFMFADDGDEIAQKVNNLMTRSGMMGDVVDTDYGKSNLSNKNRSKVETALHPMNWQRSGDYYNKGVLMVAMMKSQKIKLIDAGTGSEVEVSVWDSLNKDGELDTTKYQAKEEWYSEDISKQISWMRFREKMRIVNTTVFGNQDKNAPLLARKNWLGRMAGQFRMSWFPEGVASRLKPGYYDISLGRENKGRWVSYSDIGIFTSGMVLCKQLLNALPGVKMDPFKGHQLKDGKALTDSPIDMENMRKNFAGLAWTVSITATILMLKGLAGDNWYKTDDDRKRQLLINMLIRSQQDLMLYSSPGVFNTISGNFLPATQVLTDYWKAMAATGHYLFGDTSQEKDAFERWLRKIAKAGIPHPIATQYGKIETMMTRDLDKLQR